MTEQAPFVSAMQRLVSPWLAKIAALADLDGSARECKALQRKRKVKSGLDLLRLIFLYCLGSLSFRSTAAVSTALGVAELQDTSVLERVRHSGPWLEHLLMVMLNARCPPPVITTLGHAVTLVDGTSLSLPGSEGTDWRLHLRFDPLGGLFTDVRLTDVKVGESLSHFVVQAQDLVIGDRGYAKAKDLAQIVEKGGNFIVRIGRRSLSLRTPEGAPLDIMDLLKSISDDKPHEQIVNVAQGYKSAKTFPVRLIVMRKSEAAIDRATTKAKRRSIKRTKKVNPDTMLAAQFLMVITSLMDPQYRSELVLFLYRLRWQIELSIKRLKSILGLGHITAYDPDVVKTWILAHLVAALLIDETASPALAFSPSAYREEKPRRVHLASSADCLSRLDHQPLR